MFVEWWIVVFVDIYDVSKSRIPLEMIILSDKFKFIVYVCSSILTAMSAVVLLQYTLTCFYCSLQCCHNYASLLLLVLYLNAGS